MSKPRNHVPGLEPEGGSWETNVAAVILVPFGLVGLLAWAEALWGMGKWVWRMAVGQWVGQ